MVATQIITFNDYSQLTNYNSGGGETNVWAGDPSQVIEENFIGGYHGLKFTALAATFKTGSGIIDLIVRVKTNRGFQNGGDTVQGRRGCYIHDGTNYLFVGQSADDDSDNIAGGKMTSLAAAQWNTLTEAVIPWIIDQWNWYRLVFDQDNGTTNFYYKLNQSAKPQDDEWIESIGLADTGVAFGNLTEMGIIAQHRNGINTVTVDADDLQIIIGAGISVDNSVIGGQGNTLKVVNIYAKNTTGPSGASAKMSVHDPLHEDLATYKTSKGTVITVSETAFNTRLFQGEIKTINWTTKATLAHGIDKKLARTRAAVNPVLFIGEVEHIVTNTIYKKDKGFFLTPIWSGFEDKLVVIEKKDPKFHRKFPTRLLYENTIGQTATPDTETGGLNNIFYTIDPKIFTTISERGWYIREDTDQRRRMVMATDMWIKDGSTIDRVNVKMVVDFIGIYGHFQMDAEFGDPRIQIYDFQNTTWRTIKKIRSSQLPRTTIEITLPDDLPTGSLSDYFDQSAATTFGFAKHEFRFAALGIIKFDPIDLPDRTEILIEYMLMEALLDIDQISELGAAKIQTVNDNNIVLYGNATQSWQDADLIEDGVSVGDLMYFTDKISDIATSIWTASGMDLILNLNFTATDEVPEIEDLQDEFISVLMQKWAEMINAAWWIDYTVDPVNSLPTFNFKTSFDDVKDADGNVLVLDETDIPDWQHTVSVEDDADVERSTLITLGKDGLRKTQTITTEDTLALGAETSILKNPDLSTRRQLNLWAEGRKFLYRDAAIIVTFPLMLNRAGKDYANIQIGKYIQMKLPVADGSVVNFTSGGDGKLWIRQIELNRNENLTSINQLFVIAIVRVQS